jgi:hypothetical protein
MYRLIGSTLFAMLIGATGVSGQFVPIVAKARESSQVVKNGQVVETTTRDGEYFRSSDGSYMFRWNKATKNGVDTPAGTADLFDNKNVKQYHVNYNTQSAYARSDAKDPVNVQKKMTPDMFFNLRSAPHEDSSVGGIPCALFHSRLKMPGQPVKDGGTACASIEYGLYVRLDVRIPMKDGGMSQQLTELYDIKLNVEPDPKLFDMRSLTVYSPGT